MNRKAIFLLLTAVLFAAPAVRADQLAEATKILEFYQTENFLKGALPCMERHLASDGKDLKMTPAQKKKVESLIRRIYPADNLYKIFKVSFAENFLEDKIKRKKEFLNNAGGIKLRQAYKSTIAAGPGTRQSFYNQNAAKILTPNRKNSMMTFITSSEQDRGFAIMESRCYLAIALAHNSTLSPNNRTSVRQLKDTAEKREPSFIEEGRKKYEIFDLFLLRDHTQKEIDNLSLYYSSVDGAGFIKAYKKALVVTMESAANTLYNQMSAAKPAGKK